MLNVLSDVRVGKDVGKFVVPWKKPSVTKPTNGFPHRRLWLVHNLVGYPSYLVGVYLVELLYQIIPNEVGYIEVDIGLGIPAPVHKSSQWNLLSDGVDIANSQLIANQRTGGRTSENMWYVLVLNQLQQIPNPVERGYETLLLYNPILLVKPSDVLHTCGVGT